MSEFSSFNFASSPNYNDQVIDGSTNPARSFRDFLNENRGGLRNGDHGNPNPLLRILPALYNGNFTVGQALAILFSGSYSDLSQEAIDNATNDYLTPTDQAVKAISSVLGIPSADVADQILQHNAVANPDKAATDKNPYAELENPQGNTNVIGEIAGTLTDAQILDAKSEIVRKVLEVANDPNQVLITSPALTGNKEIDDFIEAVFRGVDYHHQDGVLGNETLKDWLKENNPEAYEATYPDNESEEEQAAIVDNEGSAGVDITTLPGTGIQINPDGSVTSTGDAGVTNTPAGGGTETTTTTAGGGTGDIDIPGGTAYGGEVGNDPTNNPAGGGTETTTNTDPTNNPAGGTETGGNQMPNEGDLDRNENGDIVRYENGQWVVVQDVNDLGTSDSNDTFWQDFTTIFNLMRGGSGSMSQDQIQGLTNIVKDLIGDITTTSEGGSVGDTTATGGYIEDVDIAGGTATAAGGAGGNVDSQIEQEIGDYIATIGDTTATGGEATGGSVGDTTATGGSVGDTTTGDITSDIEFGDTTFGDTTSGDVSSEIEFGDTTFGDTTFGDTSATGGAGGAGGAGGSVGNVSSGASTSTSTGGSVGNVGGGNVGNVGGGAGGSSTIESGAAQGGQGGSSTASGGTSNVNVDTSGFGDAIGSLGDTIGGTVGNVMNVLSTILGGQADATTTASGNDLLAALADEAARKYSTDAYTDAAKSELDFQKDIYGNSQNLYRPFYEAGTTGSVFDDDTGQLTTPGELLPAYVTGMTTPVDYTGIGFDPYDQNDPGLRFLQDEMRRQVEASAAGKGRLNTGGTLTDLQDRSAGIASARAGELADINTQLSQEKRLRDGYDLDKLGSLTGGALTAAQGMTGLNTDFATSYGSILEDLGSFQASAKADKSNYYRNLFKDIFNI